MSIRNANSVSNSGMNEPWQMDWAPKDLGTERTKHWKNWAPPKEIGTSMQQKGRGTGRTRHRKKWALQARKEMDTTELGTELKF
jgi:hypothetical protein